MDPPLARNALGFPEGLILAIEGYLGLSLETSHGHMVHRCIQKHRLDITLINLYLALFQRHTAI